MSIRGIHFAGVSAGIKDQKKDLSAIYSEQPLLACGFFTTNKVNSGSVKLSRKHLKGNTFIRLVLVNSGNANCFTGTDYADAVTVAAQAAKVWNIKEKEVLFCSTGVIGKRLPVDSVVRGFSALRQGFSEHWDAFSEAILTTDTVKKVVEQRLTLGKEEAHLVGIGKGAGMIYPDLATTLAFFMTDLRISAPLFREAAREALEDSFMSISIDGCRSTNDTVLFLSSQKTARSITRPDTYFRQFKKALKTACLGIAKKIVADAEGIHHFITIEVLGARSSADAKKVAFAIAHSALFKASVYGENPSIGRVAAAAGSCGAAIDEKKLKIIVEKPFPKEVKLTVHLHLGRGAKTVYTSDLTPEYVHENVI